MLYVQQPAVMLQRNHMVKVGYDVRRLLKRHMEMWKSNSFEALLCEAECCAAQCCNRQPRLSDDHAESVYSFDALWKGP